MTQPDEGRSVKGDPGAAREARARRLAARRGFQLKKRRGSSATPWMIVDPQRYTVVVENCTLDQADTWLREGVLVPDTDAG
jgi:hypothetical protein